MLIQSQDGYIQLLPALPDRWASGSFKGLRVRGGAEVDASWKNSRLLSATLRTETGGTFRVKVPDHVTAVKRNGKRITVENGYIALELKKGQEARVEFIS